MTSSSGVSVDPELRASIATAANASVLRRLDSSFRHVVQTASHAALYLLRNEKWGRCDVEGATFLYERIDGTFRIICVNRLSPENFTHDVQRCVRTDIELVGESMISFPAANGNICGMWFYVQDELRPFYDTLCAVSEGQSVAPLHQPSKVDKPTSNGTARGEDVSVEPKSFPESSRRWPDFSSGVESKSTLPKDHALHRFFPNLQTTASGVIGSVLPGEARTAGFVSEERRTLKGPEHPNGYDPSSRNGSMPNASDRLALSSCTAKPLKKTGVRDESTGAVHPSYPSGTLFGHNRSSTQVRSSEAQNQPQQLSTGFESSNSNYWANPPVSSIPSDTPTMLPALLRDFQPVHYDAEHQSSLQARFSQMSIVSQQQYAHAHALHPPLPMQATRFHDFPVALNSLQSSASSRGLPIAEHSRKGDERVSNKGQEAIPGILKPSALASDETRNVRAALTENAFVIGKTIGSIKSSVSNGVLDKAEFRAVVQRLLSDRKLFEAAYSSYMAGVDNAQM